MHDFKVQNIKKLTEISNRIWRNNSFDVEDVSTQVGMLTS